MNDEIGKITEEKQDYQEYVESFAHEIKIPIGALSLTFDNTKNYTLKKKQTRYFSWWNKCSTMQGVKIRKRTIL